MIEIIKIKSKNSLLNVNHKFYYFYLLYYAKKLDVILIKYRYVYKDFEIP